MAQLKGREEVGKKGGRKAARRAARARLQRRAARASGKKGGARKTAKKGGAARREEGAHARPRRRRSSKAAKKAEHAKPRRGRSTQGREKKAARAVVGRPQTADASLPAVVASRRAVAVAKEARPRRPRLVRVVRFLSASRTCSEQTRRRRHVAGAFTFASRDLLVLLSALGRGASSNGASSSISTRRARGPTRMRQPRLPAPWPPSAITMPMGSALRSAYCQSHG